MPNKKSKSEDCQRRHHCMNQTASQLSESKLILPSSRFTDNAIKTVVPMRAKLVLNSTLRIKLRQCFSSKVA